MARENPRWGYFRIRGELLKLGRCVRATTIRSVLLAAGIPPAGRRSELTWKQFLAAHAETLLAADFISVDTIFFKRALRPYICASGDAPGCGGKLQRPTDPGLGDPAGPQSQLEARGGRHQVERCDPRSGQEIRVQSRRRVQVEWRSSDPDPTHGAQGERPC